MNASALKENRAATSQGRNISVLTYTTVVCETHDTQNQADYITGIPSFHIDDSEPWIL